LLCSEEDVNDLADIQANPGIEKTIKIFGLFFCITEFRVSREMSEYESYRKHKARRELPLWNELGFQFFYEIGHGFLSFVQSNSFANEKNSM
jgi:hypothetical protein